MYITTKINRHSVIVELRNSDDELAGFIGARKSWNCDTRKMEPAEVIFNMAFNSGHTMDEATAIERLINRAVLVCELLDYYVKDIADFKKVNVRPVAGGRSVVIDIAAT